MRHEESSSESIPEFHIGGVYRTRDGGKATITERLRDHMDTEYWYGRIENMGACSWTLEGKDRRSTDKWDLVSQY